MGSKSARALSEALQAPQIRHQGSKFRGGKSKVVINWGAAKVTREVLTSRILNHPQHTQTAGNKLSFFRKVDKSLTVPWTIDPDEAEAWLKDGCTVVARQSLTGHSGAGIVIVEPGEALVKAPLYTKYIKKDSEWRIHVMSGKVIDIQRKVRDPETEPKNWKVRSHDNGFIYIRETEEPNKDVIDKAIQGFKQSGLDFGAFDVVWSKRHKRAYLLECNTAPGLSGQTIEVYAEGFKKLLA